MKLGYGSYGMPRQTVLEAVEAVSAIGYDGIELATIPNAPAAPEKLTGAERRAVHDRLVELGLELPALMLSLNGVAEDQAPELERLRASCQLAWDLAVDDPPVLVTTTGGPSSRWETDRDRLADNIAAWARVAGEAGLTVAIEAHVGGVIHRPEQAEWVRARVGLENLWFNYDESHFVLRSIPTEESARIMVPHAVATHLKDAAGDPEHVRFMLPGEGDFDYPAFFRLLHDLGYDGYLTVEVSGMVWSREDYDPLESARFCYRTLVDGLAEAGLARG